MEWKIKTEIHITCILLSCIFFKRSWHKVWPTKIELLMYFLAEVANDDKKDGNIWITF